MSIRVGISAAILLAASFTALGGAPREREREFQAAIHLSPNVSHGRQLFETCAACHGAAADGVSDGTVPAIAAQHFRVIAWELAGFRTQSRRDPRMEHFTDQHHLAGPQDIADVAAYVSQLPPISPTAPGEGSGDARGRQIYQSRCASCHGVNAEGDDRQHTPRLAGQHYQYLLHQLANATEDRRSSFAHDHMRALKHFEPGDLTSVCDYLAHLAL